MSVSEDAIRAIKEGHSFLQDVGVVSYEEAHYRQHRYMANVAGMGLQNPAIANDETQCNSIMERYNELNKWKAQARPEPQSLCPL